MDLAGPLERLLIRRGELQVPFDCAPFVKALGKQDKRILPGEPIRLVTAHLAALYTFRYARLSFLLVT